jgi:hypothetical protein
MGMRNGYDFGISVMMGVVVLALGCGGALKTGTAKKPANNKPTEDGTCPIDRSRCGTGAFAICVDRQSDPEHCGTCDQVCSLGIACQAGVCQQALCTGTTIPFSGRPTTKVATPAGQWTPITSGILADINGDGHLDLVQWTVPYGNPSPDQGEFRVSLGQPGGGFSAPDAYQASSNVLQISATDVNDDGFDDLYVFTSPLADAVTSPYRVELWIGQPDGHLIRSEAAGMSGTMVTPMMAMGDLSGDGWPDLVMQNPGMNSDHPSSLDVFLSDSTGALHLSKSYLTGWGSTFRIIIGDWNGDGSPDLVAVSDGVQILTNHGDGTFDQPVNCGLSLGIAMSGDMLVEDFNRDGRPDFALPYGRGRVGVLLGTGGCGFSPINFYAVGGASTNGLLRAADMNGDGQLDIVSISTVTSTDANGITSVEDHLLTVLLGKPDGTFQPQATSVSLGPDVADVVVGEVSGDQRPDIVIARSDGQTGTWENTCQ